MEAIFGSKDEYDYGKLCMPTFPFSKSKKEPLRFYGKDEKIPLVLALVMGIQHAFAMVGGLITPVRNFSLRICQELLFRN